VRVYGTFWATRSPPQASDVGPMKAYGDVVGNGGFRL
jgi:hypothetical protein